MLTRQLSTSYALLNISIAHTMISGVGVGARVSDLDETGVSLADIELTVEGTDSGLKRSSDGESLVAVALEGVDELFVVDGGGVKVLAAKVNDVEAGSEFLADGVSDNSEVESEVDGSGLVFSNVVEAEFANFDSAFSGGNSNGLELELLGGIISGVNVGESDISLGRAIPDVINKGGEVETVLGEGNFNIILGELKGKEVTGGVGKNNSSGEVVAGLVAVLGEVKTEVDGDLVLVDAVGVSLLSEVKDLEVAGRGVFFGISLFLVGLGLVNGGLDLHGAVVFVLQVVNVDISLDGVSKVVTGDSVSDNLTDLFVVLVENFDGDSGCSAAGLSVHGSRVGSDHVTLPVGLLFHGFSFEASNLDVARGASEMVLSLLVSGNDGVETFTSSLFVVFISGRTIGGGVGGLKLVILLSARDFNSNSLSIFGRGFSNVEGNVNGSSTVLRNKGGHNFESLSAVTEGGKLGKDGSRGFFFVGVASSSEFLDFSGINLDLASLLPGVVSGGISNGINKAEGRFSVVVVNSGLGGSSPGVLSSGGSSRFTSFVNVDDRGFTAEGALGQFVGLLNFDLLDGVAHERKLSFKVVLAEVGFFPEIELKLSRIASVFGSSFGVNVLNFHVELLAGESGVLSDSHLSFLVQEFPLSLIVGGAGQVSVTLKNATISKLAPLVASLRDLKVLQEVVTGFISISGHVSDGGAANAVSGVADAGGDLTLVLINLSELTVLNDDLVFTRLLIELNGGVEIVLVKVFLVFDQLIILLDLVPSLEIFAVLEASAGELVAEVKVERVVLGL